MTLPTLLLLAAAATLATMVCRLVFRRTPDQWLMDYDETVIPPEMEKLKSMPWFPDTLLLGLAQFLLFLLSYQVLGLSVYWALVMLTAQPLLLIMIADHKTKIIPDQYLLALIPAALFFWLEANLNHASSDWLRDLLTRLAAGFAGAFFLWLVGFIASKIMKRDAMGMGDVKLLAAAGLLVGLRWLPALLILSFFTAAFLALPLLLRRRRDPDADAEMAFGPFISLSIILVLAFHGLLANLWQFYLNLLS
ncbi:MAG: prepilin peptidase [Clostridia bacterium]|nr:A24 family peptidase [Eubacteriales bacterium]MDD3867460.1 A24 family peptidase [Eubacteriales bacterium]MDD4461952.1 A24 family peptidase [Eubacteriales bacterium]NCC49133.1 prepilin peptidase [Clostridia bacterium]